jgi:hypothetical protein
MISRLTHDGGYAQYAAIRNATSTASRRWTASTLSAAVSAAAT